MVWLKKRNPEILSRSRWSGLSLLRPFGFYIRDGKRLHSTTDIESRVVEGVHGKTGDRADLDTGVADHAPETVDGPGPLLFLNTDGLSRALAHTQAARDAQ